MKNKNKSIKSLLSAIAVIGLTSASLTAQSQGCYASDAFDYFPGLTKINTAVNPERKIVSNATGAPNAQNPDGYASEQFFLTLGFGGKVTVAFANPIANGPGDDLTIWESTGDNYTCAQYPEKASIEVSQDGVTFFYVGEVCRTESVDFGTVFSDYIRFVRITDISNPANLPGGQFTDGFDVDAVECLHGEYIIPEVGCYAIEVIEFNQAKRNDGQDVLETRSDPSKALGAPVDSDVAVPESENNFVALGFGGSITLKMSGPIANGPGADFRVVETTYGSMAGNCNRYPERIQAFASQDGCNWVYVGEGCQDVNLDLGPLDWALYIKLVDISPIGAAYNNQVADGYDLDGIICLNGFEENPVIQDLGADYAMEVKAFDQGKRKNGTDVVLSRSDASLALGAPSGTDAINFVALGFGGSITLKLGYVVFDKLGDDLQIVETSFGNPACASYPERALIEVSLDNVTYFNLGEICLDGAVDFAVAGVTAVQYVRITDRSAASSFGGSADGFDVDGVVVLQSSCDQEGDEKVIGDNIWVADETTSFVAYPNPFKNIVNLDIVTGSDTEQMNVKVMNITGQVVYTTNVNVASNSRINQTLELSSLTPGIYFISMETKNGVETQKLIKQ